MHLRSVTLRKDRYPTREHYPFNLAIFHHTDRIVFEKPVTFFVGENGTGKSTLMKALCRKCGIHIWEGEERTRMAYNPYENKLYRALDIEWADGAVPGAYFSSDIFRNFAQLLDDWASVDPEELRHFGGHSLLTLSHGQSLMTYFTGRYRIKGLYFLDEPETALSPRSQLELLKLLEKMAAAGHAQFVIASHSPILLACPGASIYSFDHAPVSKIRYEDTELYRVYRDFLEHRERYLGEGEDHGPVARASRP
ncbi:MAG: AAA family ATPase [Kiritimatiellae bacterium]|nr:AAA family ATPase [Kiritimatiellia bacterium]